VGQQLKSHNVNAELYELQNMITIGLLIVQQSIDRKENRGGLVKIN
jgi:L-aspartate oxidase